MPLRMALASPVLAATTLSCAEAAVQDDAALQRARERMVVDQIQSRGVRDPRVLAAMRSVPRHLFVPRALLADAYADHPLPIGVRRPYVARACCRHLISRSCDHPVPFPLRMHQKPNAVASRGPSWSGREAKTRRYAASSVSTLRKPGLRVRRYEGDD